MQITTHLDSRYTEKIASIQRQTQQDLSEIVGKAIDLYYQTLQVESRQLSRKQLFGCLHGQISVSADFDAPLRKAQASTNTVRLNNICDGFSPRRRTLQH